MVVQYTTKSRWLMSKQRSSGKVETTTSGSRDFSKTCKDQYHALVHAILYCTSSKVGPRSCDGVGQKEGSRSCIGLNEGLFFTWSSRGGGGLNSIISPTLGSAREDIISPSVKCYPAVFVKQNYEYCWGYLKSH